MSIDGIVLTVLAVLVGLVVGFLRRGRLVRVGGATVRAKTLLLLGVAIPVLADRFTREVAVPLVVFALAALFAFALANVRLVGMSVMAIGILGNLLATFLNGGMPVSRDALVAAGLASRDEVDRVELSGARRLEEPTHRVRFLGDIVPLEETGQVLSFGDLVILVGLADITANLTLRRRRRGTVEPVEDELDLDRDALDEIQRVLHARHPRAATPGHGPRPSPRGHAPAPVVVTADDGATTVVLEGPSFAPDVEWFAPYPPRGTFWLEAVPDGPLDALALDLPPEVPGPVFAAPPVADAPAAEPAPPVVEVAAPPLLDTPAPAPVVDRPAPEVEAVVAPVVEPVVDLTGPEPEPEPEPEVEVEVVFEPEPAPEVVVDLVAGAPVLDLAGPPATAAADDDDPLATLFRDLHPKKRTKKRGGRNIPDFEPIHVDDVISPSGR